MTIQSSGEGLFNEGDSRRASIAKATQAAYGEAGVELSLSEATEENVADFLANLVENRAEIRKLAEADLTLTQKVYKALREVFEKVKAFFSGRSVDNAEIKKRYKALQMFEQEIARVKNSAKENLPDNKSETKTERKETAGKFEIKKDKYGKEYWYIEDTKDLFKDTPKELLAKTAYNWIISARNDGIKIETIDGIEIGYIKDSAKEYVYGELAEDLKKLSENEYGDRYLLYNKKMRLAPSFSDLVDMATVKYHTPDHEATHKLFKDRGFDNYRGRVRIDNIIFNYVVRVGKASFGDVFYDIKLEVDQTLPDSKGTSGIKKGSTSNDIRLSQDNQNVKPSDEKSSSNNKDMQNEGKYSLKDKITPDMDDATRYEILKDKKINVVEYNKEKLDSKMTAEEFENLKTLRRSDAEKVLKKLGEEFGVFKDYKNTDMELEFSFSRGNLRESMHKQKGNFENYAKMMSVFTEVVENAVGIEAHSERYNTDSTLENMYVFVSAFSDGNEIIPVKLEVKEFGDRGNTLHVAVSLEGIKKGSDIVVHAANLPKASNSYTPSTSIYMIADVLKNVNSLDEDLIKYIPDGFLDAERLEAKARGIEKTKAYIETKNQQKYSKYSLKGVDTLGEFNKLTEQDNALKAKLDVKDRLIMDRRATMGQARRMVKDFGSRAKAGDVEEKIYSLYNKMLRGGDSKGPMAFNDFQKEARGIAGEILKNVSVVDAYAKERYDDFLSNLKGRTIYISEADAADISDYNDFRKRYVFRLNLKKVDGYQGSGDYVDTIYSELAAAYPDLISGEAQAVSDMLYEIGEVIDSLSEYTKNPFEGDSLTESMLTNEILESFFDVPQAEATEEQKTINRLVAERVKIREQERARYEKRLESLEKVRAEHRAEIKETIKRERAKKDSAIEKILLRQEEARVKSEWLFLYCFKMAKHINSYLLHLIYFSKCIIIYL